MHIAIFVVACLSLLLALVWVANDTKQQHNRSYYTAAIWLGGFLMFLSVVVWWVDRVN